MLRTQEIPAQREENVISRREFEASESDEGRVLVTKHREEKRVLLELYYLGKVVRAYRRPWAFGSPVFKSVLERITNKELHDQLERKLRKEKEFEEISRIGTDGNIPDRKQLQLANDYRLLAPVLLRTLRRLWSLKKSRPGDSNNELIDDLEADIKKEWMNRKAGEIEREYASEVLSETLLEHIVEQENSNGDYKLTNEDTEALHKQSPTTSSEHSSAFNEDSGRSIISPTAADHTVFNNTGPDTPHIPDAIANLIESELDKFLLVIEELSGVAGIADEFDLSDRSRMIDDVKRRYSPTVGLDQRYFIEA
uniref:Uncharacterized protein n=1 Tax=Anopheles maculatus TaxID=74869 RepID=A0A182T8I6_9DIPT